MLQFRHFIAVKGIASERLVRVQINDTGARQDEYLSLYTAVDHVPEALMDRKRYQLVTAPARHALESCAKHGLAGVVLNAGDLSQDASAASSSPASLSASLPTPPLVVLSVKDGRATSLDTPASIGRTRWAYVAE